MNPEPVAGKDDTERIVMRGARQTAAACTVCKTAGLSSAGNGSCTGSQLQVFGDRTQGKNRQKREGTYEQDYSQHEKSKCRRITRQRTHGSRFLPPEARAS